MVQLLLWTSGRAGGAAPNDKERAAMGWHHWSFLLALAATSLPAVAGRANADATAVRDTTLLELRGALERYDVQPSGTVTQLERLARIASETQDARAADEARYLYGAVASDLWFLAEFRRDAALSDALAHSLGCDAAQLPDAIERALERASHGLYREAAELALRTLRESSPNPTSAIPGIRSDALLVARALAAAKSPTPRASLAALGADPCASPKPCGPEYAALSEESRAVLWYMRVVAAAELRITHAAQVGDPLAAALQPLLSATRRELGGTRVSLLPALTHAEGGVSGNEHLRRHQALDGVILLGATALTYLALAQVRFGAEAITLDPPSGAPQRRSLAGLRDAAAEWTRTLAAIKPRGSDWHVGLVAAPDTPSALRSRALNALTSVGGVALVPGSDAATALVPPEPASRVAVRERPGNR